MVTLPIIQELELLALYDAGVPNKERVLLIAHERVALAQFVLAVCWQRPDTVVTPMGRFHWLGDQVLVPPTHLYIYSGNGAPQVGQMENGEPYITMHLGSAQTIFNLPEIVPVLFRFDSINVGRHYDIKSGKFITPAPIVRLLQPPT